MLVASVSEIVPSVPYSATIDFGVLVSHRLFDTAQQMASPHMEQVLNLFNQCSAKVIWQEINRALKLPALGQKYKYYS